MLLLGFVKEMLSDEALELIARRFAVLGEPMRLRILKTLMGGEENVGALVDATGGQQANISRHLQTLLQTGFVKRRKDGLQVYYSLADDSVFQLCEIVCGRLGQQLTEQARAFPRPT